MENAEFVLSVIVGAAICAAYMYFIVGVGRFRLDDIERIAADRNGHGFHVFGSYRPPNTAESGGMLNTQIWHIFLRGCDGKKFRAKITSHSTEFATSRSGRVDGFQGFEENIWETKEYNKSTKLLSSKVGTELMVDSEKSVRVKLEENGPSLNFTFEKFALCVNRGGAGYKIDCAGPSTWKATV